MCGLLGGQVRQGLRRSQVYDALQALVHRGPDGQALQWLPDHRFLGHARLSIVGGPSGRQPLHNVDRSVWAVVNGEFYDYARLKRKLQAKGHAFLTDSDSELLIHLYDAYGVDCLRHLHGEFAFALFDARHQRWFCARDRFGVRPLNYVHQGEDFLFASEAKALLRCGVPAHLNRDALWFAQHTQYLPPNDTLFQGIHQLRPAHYLLVDAAGLREQRYWTLPAGTRQDLSPEEAVEEVRSLLTRAVKRRVPAGVVWGCHLSGGLDSSAVSALSQALAGPAPCFTVRFIDDAFYDESPFARATAEYIGAPLVEVPVSYQDMLLALPQAVYHAEGLAINGHLGAKYLLNQAIRQHGCKVTLSGEGADELFMGYSHLKQDAFADTALSGMERGYLDGIQLPAGAQLDLSEVADPLGYVPTWLAAKASIAHQLKALWSPAFAASAGRPYARLLADSADLLDPGSRLKTSSALWMRYCLGGYILKVLDDAQSMAHGVEGRLPFLDTDLAEFLWRLPPEQHFQGTLEKALLRQAMAERLPPAVLAKTKQSFMAPPLTRALAQPPLKTWVQERLLDNQAFHAQGLFEPRQLATFLGRCATDPSPRLEPVLMTLLSLALFCERFLS